MSDDLTIQVERLLQDSTLKPKEIRVLRYLLAQTLAGQTVTAGFELEGEEGKLTISRDSVSRIRSAAGEKSLFTVRNSPYKLQLISQFKGTAPMADFKRLVEAMWALQGLTPYQQTQEYRTWCSGNPRQRRSLFGAFCEASPRSSDFITVFENFSNVESAAQGIDPASMRDIAEIFQIPGLLLYPLLSEPRTDRLITLDADEFLDVSEIQSGSPQEAGSYYIPPRRLALADATIGIVRLDKNANSNEHSHPGDELCMVLSGSIEFQFPGTGNRIVLQEGDFVHFYAEAVHRATKKSSGPAVMLVIRYYQIEPQTRQKLWTDIAEGLGYLNRLLTAQEAAFLRQVLPAFHSGEKPLIGDALGLARMLEQVARFKPTGSKPESGQENSLEEASPASIAKNTSPDELTELAEKYGLAELAAMYGIEEFLLYGFQFPAAPGMVVLRRNDPSSDSRRRKDSKPEPGEFIGKDFVEMRGQKESRAIYRIPCRNLACSDVSITHVELPPGNGTPSNSHPGLEFIYVESGTLTVTITGHDSVSVSAEGPQMCHFDALAEHVVRNNGETPAKFWAIRFYRDGAGRPGAVQSIDPIWEVFNELPRRT